MDRLTKYDEIRKCYVILPDAKQGEHVQRLGMYEDRDEAKIPKVQNIEGFNLCPSCKTETYDVYNFCPICGQRLDWGDGD